jgi:hypothetical protein
MSFYVEDKGGSFESTPVGSHLARCYRIVDLGTQKSEYQGQVKYLHKHTPWSPQTPRHPGSPTALQPQGMPKSCGHLY